MASTVRMAAIVVLTELVVSGSAQAALLDGLVAYFPFSGNSHDASGNGNNGSVYGATLAPDMFGNASSAFHFSGSQYIDAANPASLLDGRALTIAAWVYLDQVIPTNMQVVQKDTSGEGNAFAMQILGTTGCLGSDCKSASRFGLVLTSGGQYRNNAWSSAFLPVRQWLHLAATYDNHRVNLLINGVTNNSVPLSGNFDNSEKPLNIGRLGWDNRAHFQGAIDEVMTFNRALSESEIRQLYQRYNVEEVAEPATLCLLAAGLAGLAALRRRR